MSLTEKDIEKLDWKSEHGATLETHELLEVLAKIAEDPQAYTEAQFDAAYTRAEQLANALRGMMSGLRAAEIAKTFKRAVKARAACEKYDLVPKAKLGHAQEQLRAAGAMNIAIEARIASMAPKADPIGPGDPLPPPPPPTLTAEDIQLAWDECSATKSVMLGYKMAVQLADACNDVLLMKTRNKSNKLHELA
jgi:hypothetical protein